MSELRVVVTEDTAPAVEALTRSLGPMLAGLADDPHGLVAGFQARIGWATHSLIAPNFEVLGRGGSGADGDSWPPPSRKYLAYRKGPPSSRRGSGRSPGRGVGSGFMSADEERQWWRTYARNLAWLAQRHPLREAKARAAAAAWAEYKRSGGKTKLDVFGDPSQQQTLVDRGTLRRSLQPGVLSDRPDAGYEPPDQQAYRAEPGRTTVGSAVRYAITHHAGRGNVPRRRLWPERFPGEWWRQILGAGVSGIVRIVDLLREKRA